MTLASLILYLFSQLISPLPGGHQYAVNEYHANSDTVKTVKILRNYGDRIECDFITGQATLIAVDNDNDINPDQLFILSRASKGAAAQYTKPEEQKKDFESAKKFMYDSYRAYFYNKDKTQKNKVPKLSAMPDRGYQFTKYEDKYENVVKILRKFDNSAEGWSLKEDTTFVVLDMEKDGNPEYSVIIIDGNGEYYTLSKPENFMEKYKAEDLMEELYKEDEKARGIK